MNSYTIQENDTLFTIAQKLLGNGARYHEFTQWNSWLTDPDTQVIYPGQKLAYPSTTPTDISTELSPLPYQPTAISTGSTILSRIMSNKLLLLAVVAGIVGIAAWQMGYLDSILGKSKRRANPTRTRKSSKKRWSKSSEVQSILFPLDEWDERDAKTWLRDNDYKVSKVHVTDDYLRYRQMPITKFVKSHLRTKEFGEHDGKLIKAIVGEPK